ncbi:MAG: 16S rRNA (cytidine(1402)-2'-O)-methyltransferase [Actinobacteria bacterium]|nr:16S rRNA (cytidine(1402)-2'-O)-methyltransferase [Actinomycetota bacterium]
MLYVCPTPIGNLGDITLRVLEVLRSADLVAAEDTRRTRKLLAHYQISKPLVSFFEHNELKRLPALISQLERGETIALVSDAGMPGVCDPGYRLIKTALAKDLPVRVLPGPSATLTALVSSGLPTDSFLFWGYLPRKPKEREQALMQIGAEPRTCVAFESPRRLKATLTAAAAILGDRKIAVCRELSKKFEEVTRGTATSLAAGTPDAVKGEIVLVFAGAVPEIAPEEKKADGRLAQIKEPLSQMLAAGLSARQAAGIVVSLAGISRNQAYRMALEIKKTGRA